MQLAAAATMDVEPVSRLLRALGEETRLRIVALLSHGELCVCHIENVLGLSQPNASRHLAVLKAAGIVQTRRRGNWIYYRLAPQEGDECRRLLRTVVGSFAKSGALALDVRRVTRCCGPEACS